jgi:hypothetical protein
MMRRLIVLLVLTAASAALLAAPAAATTTPARPLQPPSAYVETAWYEGCSDWYLQSTYPMSGADPQWVFTCWNDYYADASFPMVRLVLGLHRLPLLHRALRCMSHPVVFRP